MNDQVAMRQIREGNQSTLGLVYDRYSSIFYSVAFRTIRDSGSAGEVLQDTFSNCGEKPGNSTLPRGSLICWLITITRHRAISRVREMTARSYFEALDDELVLLHPNVEPSVLGQQILGELTFAALTRLPSVQREAIILAYVEGLTCREIAARTEAPVETVKSRL